ATAAFVGLFGTVWGIMNSFIGISKSHTTNLAVVAPGIAEALLATAFGLAAAIPAVVIYNVFARSIAGYRAGLGDAAAEVLRLVSRHLQRPPTVAPTSRSRRYCRAAVACAPSNAVVRFRMSPVANPTRILTFGRNLCGFDYEVAPSVPSMKSAVLDNLLQGRGQCTVRVVMPCSGRKRVE